MKVLFNCPSCGSGLESEGGSIGFRVACPGCGKSTHVPKENFASGTRIGGFEIVRLLGRGGMGEVYLARQLAMGREVALKVLSADFAARKGAVERFVKEVHLAARLEHAHIVTAFDAGEDEGLYYMAMSFVRGLSLSDYLARHGVMKERDSLRMVRKLAVALDYAWKHGQIIHRDIKPANILLDESLEPKLADMGLSKSLEDDEALTMSGAIMGTPNYMSPEQTEGRSDIDCRSDMYALGATLYHMVTGQMPFAGSSIVDVLRKQATEMLPDPREFNPAISEGCVHLLEVMLAKKREERHADWPALMTDIDAVLGGKPASVATPAAGSVLIRRGGGPGHLRIVVPKEGLSPHRPAAAAHAPPKKVKAARRIPWLKISSVAATVLIVAAAIAWFAHSTKQAQKRGDAGRAEQQAVAARQAQQAREEQHRQAVANQQEEMWQAAAAFVRDNPDNYDAAVGNFEAVRRKWAGTKYEVMANGEIDKVRQARAAALASARASLQTRADALAEAGEFEQAADVYAVYNGPFSKDLAEFLEAGAARHGEQARQAAERLTQAQREAKGRERAAIAQAAEAIYVGDFGRARAACRGILDDAAIPIDKEVLTRLAGWIEQAAGADQALLDSLLADRGKELETVVAGVPMTIRIASIKGGRVTADQKRGAGWATVQFALSQLSGDEQFKRLEARLDPPALGLWAGVYLVRAGKPDKAAEYFRQAGPLATALLERAESGKAEQREVAARSQLGEWLKSARLPVMPPAPEAAASAVAAAKPTPAQASALVSKLDAFAAAHAGTQFAEENRPVLDALRAALDAVQAAVANPVKPAPAIARHPPKPPADDFMKRVREARARTGEIIRAGPEAAPGGVLSIDEALKRLRPGMVLKLQPGDWNDEVPLTVPVRDVVIDGSDGAVVASRVTISGHGCVVRNITVTTPLYVKAADVVLADAKLMNVSVNAAGARADIMNCFVRVIICAQGAGFAARNCTIVCDYGPALYIGQGAAGTLTDSIVVTTTASAIDLDSGAPRILTILRCLIHGEPGISKYARIEEIPNARFEDCVFEKAGFADARKMNYRLSPGSPGKGAGPGGRDLGANLDETGMPVPFDPED